MVRKKLTLIFLTWLAIQLSAVIIEALDASRKSKFASKPASVILSIDIPTVFVRICQIML